MYPSVNWIVSFEVGIDETIGINTPIANEITRYSPKKDLALVLNCWPHNFAMIQWGRFFGIIWSFLYRYISIYIYTYLYKYTWIELVRSQLESSFRSLWTVLIMSAPVSGVIPKSFRRPNQTYECTIRWPILGHFTDLKNLGLIPFLTRTGIVDLQVPPMMGPWLYSNLEANFAAHNY